MDDSEVVSLPLDQLDPMLNQSRERFDDATLKELSDNIKALGQLQPGVAVFDEGRNRYVLICGERRYRALKLAGLPAMSVRLLKGPLSQGQMLAINLAENVQRDSLNPVEKARAFSKLMKLEALSATEVAARMNVSNASVSRYLSLLDLPETLQQRVMSGELPSSVASVIARVGDDETRRDIADQYASGTIARDGVTAKVNGIVKAGKPAPPKPIRLKLGGVSLTISRKQTTIDTLLASLGKIRDAVTELKRKPGADINDLPTVLKAS